MLLEFSIVMLVYQSKFGHLSALLSTYDWGNIATKSSPNTKSAVLILLPVSEESSRLVDISLTCGMFHQKQLYLLGSPPTPRMRIPRHHQDDITLMAS